MTINDWGQIIGFVALAVSTLVFLGSTRGRILILKTISDALWSVSYILTNAYTGALIAGINVLRSLVFYQRDRHAWADKAVWPILFLIATASAAAVTWQGWISIFPALGSMLAVLAFYNRSPRITRLSAYLVQGLWLIYACLVVNYASIVCNVLMMVSATIGLIRDRRAARRAQTAPAEKAGQDA